MRMYISVHIGHDARIVRREYPDGGDQGPFRTVTVISGEQEIAFFATQDKYEALAAIFGEEPTE